MAIGGGKEDIQAALDDFKDAIKVEFPPLLHP
jgi:hypothetical protein